MADFSFGFDTAVNVVTEAVDRLRTTTESHRRIMVVETMGRHSGWIACFAGMAVGADYILVPEVPIDLAPPDRRAHRAADGRQELRPRDRRRRGPFPDREPLALDLDPDPFGHVRLGGIGRRDRRGHRETDRVSRPAASSWATSSGAAPHRYDRVLATRMGLAASQLVLQHRFGTVVTAQGGSASSRPP